ncbi:MAG: DUF1501 domain-containing protein [Burkholderiaceae bacterium]
MNSRRRLMFGAGGAAALTALNATTGSGAGMFGAMQRMAAAAGDAMVSNAHAQSADDYKALVCLFMHGGNDANNMIVPLQAGQYGLYQQARGRLALGTDVLLPVAPVNTGGESFGFHPAMTQLQNLFSQGSAAVVANVGPLAEPTSKAQYDARSVELPPNLMSHSDQQGLWQSGTSDGLARTGWAGRVGDLMQSMNTNRGATCLSLSGNNIWQNGTSLTSYKVSPSGNFGFNFYRENSNDPLSVSIGEILNSQRGHLFEAEWLKVISRALENQRVMADAIDSDQFEGAFPGSSLGRQLGMAARLIAARNTLGMRRQTLFVSIGGFDTHGDDQLWRQESLLGQISEAVSAFYDATVTLGVADKVTLFTASDFNRNLQSNGQGSDHAWGSHHLVVGGAVQGNSIVGQFPNLTLGGPDDARDSGIWIPTTSTEQFAGTMATWFGVSPTEMATVMPTLDRFATPDLGFLG